LNAGLKRGQAIEQAVQTCDSGWYEAPFPVHLKGQIASMAVELSTQTGDNPQTPILGRFVTGKSVLVKDNQDPAAGSRLSFTNDERIAPGSMDPMNSPQRITPDVGAGSHDVPIIARPINTTTHG
jgi:hypothetical protein